MNNNILLVEDYPKDVDLVIEWMTTNLYSVCPVYRVEDVRDTILTNNSGPELKKFSAAIVDLHFGAGREIAGFQAIELINQMAHIPVIVFTGTADDVKASRASQLNVHAVVLKGQSVNGATPKQNLLNAVRDALAVARLGNSVKRSIEELQASLDKIREELDEIGIDHRNVNGLARASYEVSFLNGYLLKFNDMRIK